MAQFYLLFIATILYAGYNLLIKVSGDQVPISAETTISLTIVLQLAALSTSIAFAGVLLIQGVDILKVPSRAYVWAILAGLCIGGAEIAYIYLFSGLGSPGISLPANVIIPFVVGGTVVITMIVSVVVFKEIFGWPQMLGALLVVIGVSLLFVDGNVITGRI